MKSTASRRWGWVIGWGKRERYWRSADQVRITGNDLIHFSIDKFFGYAIYLILLLIKDLEMKWEYHQGPRGSLRGFKPIGRLFLFKLFKDFPSQGGAGMQLKKFGIIGLGLVFFILISLQGPLIYSAENLSPGSVLPGFKISGPDSPQAKAYLGIPDEKLFSLSQVKGKLVLIEFFDVF
jgi:hypothetical protein